VQRCFVDFFAQTKRNFAHFDFLRIAQLHFDGNGADDRHTVSPAAASIVDEVASVL